MRTLGRILRWVGSVMAAAGVLLILWSPVLGLHHYFGLGIAIGYTGCMIVAVGIPLD